MVRQVEWEETDPLLASREPIVRRGSQAQRYSPCLFIFLQAGNPAVNGGEERDTVRNNHRSVADRLPTPNVININVRYYI